MEKFYVSLLAFLLVSAVYPVAAQTPVYPSAKQGSIQASQIQEYQQPTPQFTPRAIQGKSGNQDMAINSPEKAIQKGVLGTPSGVKWQPSCRCEFAEPGSKLRCICGTNCECYYAVPFQASSQKNWIYQGNGLYWHPDGYTYQYPVTGNGYAVANGYAVLHTPSPMYYQTFIPATFGSGFRGGNCGPSG